LPFFSNYPCTKEFSHKSAYLGVKKGEAIRTGTSGATIFTKTAEIKLMFAGWIFDQDNKQFYQQQFFLLFQDKLSL